MTGRTLREFAIGENTARVGDKVVSIYKKRSTGATIRLTSEITECRERVRVGDCHNYHFTHARAYLKKRITFLLRLRLLQA